jgi:bacillithiol system protein YtxJ
MHPNVWDLRRLEDIETLLVESASRPVLLLKHSYSCGTSAQALDELLAHVDERDAHDVRFAMVTVQTDRSVSNAIASRLGIRHETPQALLLRDGKVVWQASHFRVTADAIAEAISRYAAAASA